MAVAVAVVTGRYFSNWNHQGQCRSEDAVETAFGTVNPCECFSETYLEARSKFRRAADDAGAERFTLNIYQNYTMDIAYLKGEREGGTDDLVVHTSGVHGVEGYAGSAVQQALLRLHSATPPTNKLRTSLLLIHAVNPYGMAHYRRFNENNVDLNRNGIHDFSQVSQRDPNLVGYVDLDAIFNPTRPFRLGFFAEAIPAILKHGLTKLKKAMVTGQYHKSTGIFYGGMTRMEASNQKLYDFCQGFLNTHRSSGHGKTTWINVHTGLGKSGIDTILVGSEMAAIQGAVETVARVFHDSLVPGVTGGHDVQDGYDMMIGATEQLMRPLFPSPDDWIITQEFGTVPSVFVARAIILENMRYNHLGDTTSDILRSAFYPRTLKWRRSILTRGVRIVQQAMER
jgi:Protein of unknown function (DUF2817)